MSTDPPIARMALYVSCPSVTRFDSERLSASRDTSRLECHYPICISRSLRWAGIGGGIVEFRVLAAKTARAAQGFNFSAALLRCVTRHSFRFSSRFVKGDRREPHRMQRVNAIYLSQPQSRNSDRRSCIGTGNALRCQTYRSIEGGRNAGIIL